MRIPILGINISKITLTETIQFLSNYNYCKTNYICLPDLSVLIAAQNDQRLKDILNNSLLTLPDGKYIEFIGRLKGFKGIESISGYWLIKDLLECGLNHFFYGGNPESMKLMIKNINTAHPMANIAGFACPPLLSLDQIKDNTFIVQDILRINHLKPDIIWLGISSPKQDYLAHYYHTLLERGLIIAVGGVFDYLAETRKKSPEWIKRIGLRWLFRFSQEPRRLWKKYFYTFLGLLELIFSRMLMKH